MLREVDINLNVFVDKNKIQQMDLRSEKITKISSKIAKLKFVRQKLISSQRKFANYPPNGVGSI